MTETIESLFIYLATFIALLPIFLFFVKRAQLGHNTVIKFAVAYAAIEFLVNSLSFRLSMPKIRLLYSIFTAVEYGLFASILFRVVNSPFAKKAIKLLTAFFYIFWILYRIFDNFSVLDSVPIGVETILILIFAFRFFYEQMDDVKDGFIYDRFSFWITAGILIYLAGSFFCYMFANLLEDHVRNTFWIFTNVFTAIKYVFFCVAILIETRKKSGLKTNHYSRFIHS